MASKEDRRVGDKKKQIVDGITSARVRSKTLQKPSHIRQFLRQYFENIPVEDLQDRPEKLLARAAVDHLEFGATRRKGKALLRIFNQTEKENGYSSPRTIVEMVNDDMPFLVDSVSSAINRHNLAVHITVHPIIYVRRNSKGTLTAIAKPGRRANEYEVDIDLHA